MRTNDLVLAMTLAVTALGCGGSVVSNYQDERLVDGATDRSAPFGAACQTQGNCVSGLCVATSVGRICSRPCSDGCPDGWACAALGGASDGACVPAAGLACQPCLDDGQCGPSGVRCVPLGPASYCTLDCRSAPCPAGYQCQDVPDAASDRSPRVCLPDSGSCGCAATTIGQTRGCWNTSASGTCFGDSVCTVDGWSACDCGPAAPEVCNGSDDDCDGWLDGADPDVRFPGATADDARCQWGVGCQGTWMCGTVGGSQAWSCSPDADTEERCDYIDNDCDGRTDDPFVVGSPPSYAVRVDDCGGCGVDCRLLVPNADELECVTDGGPRCHATRCAPGFFSWGEGVACLPLVRTLCQPCQVDADCVTPGSRCLLGSDGQRACGLDCSSDSLFDGHPLACPGLAGDQGCCGPGYRCELIAGDATYPLQCVPLTGTCSCNVTTQDLSRSCTVSDPYHPGVSCLGLQACRIAAGVHAWERCSAEGYSVELCNLADDDCDGTTDDDFVNQNGSYTYDTDPHCAVCNNNCGALWIPDLHHAIGRCDATQTPPRCAMRCLEMFQDVNGDPSDGCECRFYGSVDLPDAEFDGYPHPNALYRDTNCDGIDGQIEEALFVSAANPAAGDGSRENPFRTIAGAVAVFAGSGKSYILVAQGVYPEQLVLAPGLQLHGGYAGDFFSRDIVLFPSILAALQPNLAGSHARGTVNAACDTWAAGGDSVLSGFTVYGYDVTSPAPPNQPGYPSYALYVKDCGAQLTVRNNVLAGGTGGVGASGQAGGRGHGAEDGDLALRGASSTNVNANLAGPCANPDTVRFAGAAGGVNAVCGTWGMRGANTFCPQSFNNPAQFVDGSTLTQTHIGNQPEYRPCAATFDDCCFNNDPGASPTCATTPYVCMIHDGQSQGVCAARRTCTTSSDCDPGTVCVGTGPRYCQPAGCAEDRDCPSGWDCNGGVCQAGDYGRPGQSGSDSSYNVAISGCGQITESGFPGRIDFQDGRPGLTGALGHAGAPGDGCTEPLGGLGPTDWRSDTDTASDGGPGRPGQPGGGGGASGGVSYHAGGYAPLCGNFAVGVPGGGGGAGGCGGSGGLTGTSGGTSIALLIFFVSDPDGDVPVIVDNLVGRGRGGSGGRGGDGAYGGQGGAGGAGAEAVVGFARYYSGGGGRGGSGGPGGGGGGGCGGSALGLVLAGSPSARYLSDNQALSLAPSAGLGGTGGGSPAGASAGSAGTPGRSRDQVVVCYPGCPSGLSCVAGECQ